MNKKGITGYVLTGLFLLCTSLSATLTVHADSEWSKYTSPDGWSVEYPSGMIVCRSPLRASYPKLMDSVLTMGSSIDCYKTDSWSVECPPDMIASVDNEYHQLVIKGDYYTIYIHPVELSLELHVSLNEEVMKELGYHPIGEPTYGVADATGYRYAYCMYQKTEGKKLLTNYSFIIEGNKYSYEVWAIVDLNELPEEKIAELLETMERIGHSIRD